MKPSEQNGVFPPFSGELREDGKLKLSHMNLKQTIVDIINGKVVTPRSQLTATPAFPTPHVLDQFVSKVHTDYKKERMTLSMRHG
jgi:hypothetical protein